MFRIKLNCAQFVIFKYFNPNQIYFSCFFFKLYFKLILLFSVCKGAKGDPGLSPGQASPGERVKNNQDQIIIQTIN